MANSESTEEDLTKSFNHRESPEAATSPIEIARIRSKIEEIGSGMALFHGVLMTIVRSH
jgi:hypothetical protein